jgi:hypothetical protein
MLKNHGLFTLWMQCLLSASHKAHSQIIGNQKIDLLPGQFVFGRKSWADKLGATEKQVRVWVETLQKHGRIEATTRASKFTVFSVVNWECYQEDTQQQGQQQGQQKGQQRASKGPAKGHKQELKNEKNEKNKGKENIPHGSAVTVQTDPPFYLTKKKRKLTGKRLEAFDRFWKAFAYPKGKAEAADAWLDIPTLTDSLVDEIVKAAEGEALARPKVVASGQTPKWAQGWISGRRWEDEATIEHRELTAEEKTARDMAELRRMREQGVTQ